MANINNNFFNLQDNYLFSIINEKVHNFKVKNPSIKLINMGIGDVTRPLPKSIIDEMHKAVDEMGNYNTFHGYGPEQGYEFLREAIKNEYKNNNIDIDLDEIFISDGTKCDTGNILDIFKDNTIAVVDPIYPVYIDSNVISGNIKHFDKEKNKYSDVIYIPLNENNNFKPELPKEHVDIIYLCFPNNPTGTVLNKSELKKWINYAKLENSIILYDSAYEAFITEKDIPHSIYEIEGSKDVAIEFKSFSKSAGFTGIRCAYTIIPKNIDNSVINKLWHRRISTKFNGVSYITQRAAFATFSEKGKKELKESINYYLENARIIKEGLIKNGFTVYGGNNSPYIWVKIPGNLSSWQFFDKLLEESHIICTPGCGFGPSGEGYFRLTSFGTREDAIEVVNRLSIKKM